MSPIYLNGKFLAQRATGVQRAAREWVHALDELLGTEPRADDERWVLLHPPGVEPPRWRHIENRRVGNAPWSLHAWEQWTLPLAALDGALVNLAGSAPWLAKTQLATIHDAAVWDIPEAYTWPFRLWYRVLFRRLARQSRGMLTVSDFSRSRLCARLGIAADRFELIGNGCDHFARVCADESVFERLGLGARRYVLAVASASPAKNLHRLIEAVDSLDPSLGVALVLVGGANHRVFASHGALAGPNVIVVGAVDDASLKALMESAMVLAVPSLYEGFGLPPLEAMACGCPVIAARAAALPETCGDAAWYVDPLSIQSIAVGLRCLAEDDQLRRSLIERGRMRAKRFTWQRGAATLRARAVQVASEA